MACDHKKVGEDVLGGPDVLGVSKDFSRLDCLSPLPVWALLVNASGHAGALLRGGEGCRLPVSPFDDYFDDALTGGKIRVVRISIGASIRGRSVSSRLSQRI